MSDAPTNPVTELRVGLVALLAAAFPKADVRSGEGKSGVQRTKDQIRVFWEGTPAGANVNYGEPRMRIRYWKKLPRASSQLKNEQRDDYPLEQGGWDMDAALMPARTTITNKAYFEIKSTTPIRDEFAVETILIVRLQRPGANPQL